MKKAVQQIMLGTVTKNEKQTAETLRRIRAAGYDGIELNGFMVKPTSFLVRMLTKAAGMPVGKGGSYDWNALVKEAGLCVTSIHEDLGTIRREPETVAKEAEAFGTKYVVITGMYRFDYADKAAVQGLCRDLNTSGKILKEAGIELLYHNHNCEFLHVEPQKTAYDLLLSETDPEYVNFELDSYWPTEAGVAVCQAASQSSRGVLDETLGTVNIRMPGYMPASAMASTAPSTGWNMNPLTGISMLDCPEQTHTSPSITLSSTTSLPSLTVTV